MISRQAVHDLQASRTCIRGTAYPASRDGISLLPEGQERSLGMARLQWVEPTPALEASHPRSLGMAWRISRHAMRPHEGWHVRTQGMVLLCRGQGGALVLALRRLNLGAAGKQSGTGVHRL